MDGMGDYLKKRAVELGMDREGQLTDIQAYLNKLYPGQCRAVSLNKGVLKITTPNASIASELRFKSVAIRLQHNIDRIYITIS